MKYLVLFCDLYSEDLYSESDGVIPCCMTNDPEKYWHGKYKIYKIKDDHTFALIKDLGVTNDKGMAVYQWTTEDDPMVDDPEIIRKWNDRGRNNFSLQNVSIVKAFAHFEAPAEDILADIESCGAHGEEIDGYWVVLGEYIDDDYSCGY